jgi:hypothetical protein
MEAVKAEAHALVKKLRQEVVDDMIAPIIVEFTERAKDVRQVRIEQLLEELDINVMAIAAAHKTFNLELVKHLEERVEFNFKGLAQYGIIAKTFAEAKEQYAQRFGGVKGETVQDKIRREINARRRLGAELEADRARLVKEFPDQEAFINNEYRKEQGNLRKTL